MNRDVRERLSTAFGAYGSNVRLAILFGSQAREEATSASDVDVAIFAPDVDHLALASHLGRALRSEVDVVDLSDPSIALLEELLRDGIVVHEGALGAGAAWRSRILMQLETDRPAHARMTDAWLRRVATTGLF